MCFIKIHHLKFFYELLNNGFIARVFYFYNRVKLPNRQTIYVAFECKNITTLAVVRTCPEHMSFVLLWQNGTIKICHNVVYGGRGRVLSVRMRHAETACARGANTWCDKF